MLEQEWFPLAAFLHGQISLGYSLSHYMNLVHWSLTCLDTFIPKSSTTRLTKLPNVSLWSSKRQGNLLVPLDVITLPFQASLCAQDKS